MKEKNKNGVWNFKILACFIAEDKPVVDMS
jgi:hypothetical protein